MESIRFTLNSNTDILDIIDKTAEHILIHNFQPHNIIEWWESTIKLNPKTTLENISVRNMQFDVQTDISTLVKILELNSNFLDVYQFNNPISDTLLIDNLPSNNAETILIQNGLQHIINIHFESITISSINPDFIKGIAENSRFKDLIRFKSY